MRLNDVGIRIRNRPGKMGDGRGGRGLYVLYRRKKNGKFSRIFCQRLRIHGKVCDIGLGTYPDVKLKKARKKVRKNWKVAKKGKDPRVKSRVPTFGVVVDQVIASRRAGWKNSKTEKNWESSLRHSRDGHTRRQAGEQNSHRRHHRGSRADLDREPGRGQELAGANQGGHEAVQSPGVDQKQSRG